MTLLISPIDGSPMRQINRYGIEIDVCPTTGGIWLDKGELEKLIAIIKEDAMNDNSSIGRANSGNHREASKHYHGDDDDYYDRNDHHSRKKGKMSRIAEIFDF